MIFDQWVQHNFAVEPEGAERDRMRQAWDAGLGHAMIAIRHYGDQYRKSSLKVGMAVDACEEECRKLRTQ